MTENSVIEQRIPVWDAFGELFTYPNVSSSYQILERIIDACLNSGYSLVFLENIYYYEFVPTIFAVFDGTVPAILDGKYASSFIGERILATRHNKLLTEQSTPSIFEKIKVLRQPSEVRTKWHMLKALLQRCMLNHNSQSKHQPQNILKQRLSVWLGLSELYLHSDIDELETLVASIIEACKKSGYSLNMLEKIYAYEVIPALSKGLGGFGLEAENHWSGFEPDFLSEKILSYTKGELVTEKSEPTIYRKLSSRLRTACTKESWETIKPLLAKALG